MSVRGITTCVDYSDLLSLTLERNLRFMDECLVVTCPRDEATIRLVEQTPRARLLVTDAFTRYEASFNKGLALEEGFDAMGRDGWILIWDADIVFPDQGMEQLFYASLECMYTPRRRILDDPFRWSPGLDWRKLPVANDTGNWGYFQLFHASARPERPWYDPTFVHAGGCDHYFERLWQREKLRRPPLEVLHLGPRDQNWFGRVTGNDPQSCERRARLKKLREANGWVMGVAKSDANDRITVPGYESKHHWWSSKPCQPSST